MDEPIYHRLHNWNLSLYGPEFNTVFEAAFLLTNDGDLLFSGRVLSSDNTELFCTQDLQNLPFPTNNQAWNPTQELEAFIQDVANLRTPDENPIWFMTPFCLGIDLETKVAPTLPRGYWLSIHMHHFTILGKHQWRDSGTISINMMCEGKEFLSFLKHLKSDLDLLLLER